MLQQLKRLWYSISFRLSIVILLVFGVGNYYGIKLLGGLVSATTGASQCVSTSRHLSHYISSNLYHVENTLKSASLALNDGMKRNSALLICKPLIEQELAYKVYFKPVAETPQILQECLLKNQDFFNDSLKIEDQKLLWTDLYVNEGKHVITAALRVGDKDLLCADLRTEWMRKYIEESKPQEDAVISISSPSNTLIYHSDTTMLMKHGQFVHFDRHQTNDGVTFSINNEGSEGEFKTHYSLFDAAAMFFGDNIKPTNWYLNCEIPRDSPYGGFSTFVKYSVISIYSFILFIAAMIILISARHMVKPIRKMTDATQEIARGNFKAPLPKIKSHTDIRLLRDSFESMQNKLSRYVEDIKVATEQKASMDRDLQIAHDIQQGLLPQNFPAFPERNDLDIYGLQLPAKQVGGDLFDFQMRDNKLYFCIGDVSGKGVPAALFMSVTCNLFRYSAKSTNDPAAIVSAINNQLEQGNESNLFCTLFVGVLNMETGHLNYCNAGHNGPILIHEGECSYIKPNGDIPAGLIKDFPYKNESTDLCKDDVVFLYTDGVTEAENRTKDLFGEKALMDVVTRCKNCNMNDLAENVRYEVSGFVNYAEQSDDFTILCLKYNPNN